MTITHTRTHTRTSTCMLSTVYIHIHAKLKENAGVILSFSHKNSYFINIHFKT